MDDARQRDASRQAEILLAGSGSGVMGHPDDDLLGRPPGHREVFEYRRRKNQIEAFGKMIREMMDIPDDIDILNLAGREWRHPCDDGDEEVTRRSFPEIFDAALKEAVEVLTILKESWNAPWTERARTIVAGLNWFDRVALTLMLSLLKTRSRGAPM